MINMETESERWYFLFDLDVHVAEQILYRKAYGMIWKGMRSWQLVRMFDESLYLRYDYVRSIKTKQENRKYLMLVSSII